MKAFGAISANGFYNFKSNALIGTFYFDEMHIM